VHLVAIFYFLIDHWQNPGWFSRNP